MIGMRFGVRGVGGGSGLAVVAVWRYGRRFDGVVANVMLGRGFVRGVFGGESEARAMLRSSFHLSSEDKGRAERQHDAGQLREHGRKIVPGAAPVNAAPRHRCFSWPIRRWRQRGSSRSTRPSSGFAYGRKPSSWPS
eukprot:Opistho-2@943